MIGRGTGVSPVEAGRNGHSIRSHGRDARATQNMGGALMPPQAHGWDARPTIHKLSRIYSVGFDVGSSLASEIVRKRTSYNNHQSVPRFSSEAHVSLHRYG